MLDDLLIKVDKGDVTITKIDYFKHDGAKAECYAFDINALNGCKIVFETK